MDKFLPKTSFQLAGGEVLTIGTTWDQESVRQMVLLQHVRPGEQIPAVEIAVSSDSVDLLINALQKAANTARYVNGKKLLNYLPPQRERPIQKAKKPRKAG